MKDNIALGAVILAFLIGAVVACVSNPYRLIDGEILAMLNVNWLLPAARHEVRYIEPITVIGHRKEPGSATVALAPALRALDGGQHAAGSMDSRPRSGESF